MYGSLTTKELKKIHSSKLVGGAERMHGKAVAGRQGRRWSVCRQDNASEHLATITCGVVVVRETASLLKAGQELSKWYCSLSDPSPTYSTTTQ